MKGLNGEENLILIEIPKEHGSGRIDRVLSVLLPEMSRSHIQRLIEGGCVTVNGVLCKSKKEAINMGAKVTLKPYESVAEEVLPEDIPLNIVYEDDYVLVVDKIKGMVVHPSPGHSSGTLVNAVMHHCKDRLSSINGVKRPGIIHRIDKDTGGLLMIAKTDIAHNRLAKQLAEHTIVRGYKAIVYNSFAQEEGMVNAPIGRDPYKRLRQGVNWVNGKEAVTHYKVLEPLGKYSFIQARLETGRTHQIRVHMAYIKHPLVGDLTYGPSRNIFGVKGQMLHAYLLGFIHPVSQEYMEFHSPLPEEFEKVLKKMRDMIGMK